MGVQCNVGVKCNVGMQCNVGGRGVSAVSTV